MFRVEELSMPPKAKMNSSQTTQQDWSRTPAAMVCAAVLGIASLAGLYWSMSTDSKPTHTLQSVSDSSQPDRSVAPARLLIDLNTANQSDLQLLPSIGPKLAQRIIDDRAEHGPFTALKDLDRVKGIGPKTLARLEDWVTLTQP